MAITNKVSKPALSPEWQNAIENCSLATDVAGAAGFTTCSYAGTQAIQLLDGHYNGQMAVIYAATAHNKTVTPDNILGNGATFVIPSKACGIFIWYNDGTTSGWACLKGAAGT